MGNQLSQLMPIPQHAWDKKSSSGPVGNWDQTTAGATAVYNFLIGESKKTSSYASNPLWQVVDGPWKLSQYRTDGYSKFVPNSNYSGAVKPKLGAFVEQPFTTQQAELNVLRTGRIDYGYIPRVESRRRRPSSGRDTRSSRGSSGASTTCPSTSPTRRPGRSSSSSTSVRRCRC
jgi:ABC-type oligopeptide transport system substrate-binding subunit